MKESRLSQMQNQMMKYLNNDQSPRVVAAMQEEYQNLCSADQNRPQDLLRHLHNNIFPVVATFHALQQEGMDKDAAAKLATDSFLELMEEPAAAIRKLCKIPGVYRCVPWLFRKLMPKLFTTGAGFTFTFHPTERGHVKFDMTNCPYYNVCKELGCPELAPAFCTTDDICYGHMHPRLSWNRTQTLARGGHICDFDLNVKTPEKAS